LPCTSTRSPLRDGTQGTPIVWLPIDSIDEPSPTLNSRRSYRGRSISELAGSLREHGFLQPLCVRRLGQRYELVFGVRRLRAAAEAGFSEVPCTINEANDARAFELNAMENLHHEHLSGAERVRTIRRFAASGVGVREISRRTGFNPSTISRWLRITHRPELEQALADGRLDIARAVVLVEAPIPALRTLIEQAPTMPVAELRRQVAAMKHQDDRGVIDLGDRTQLIEALRCLRGVRSTREQALLEYIRREIERLSAQGRPMSAA
jgi:ParB/RepB/Spo0J family partition protein